MRGRIVVQPGEREHAIESRMRLRDEVLVADLGVESWIAPARLVASGPEDGAPLHRGERLGSAESPPGLHLLLRQAPVPGRLSVAEAVSPERHPQQRVDDGTRV